MLKRNLKVPVIVLLLSLLLIPAYISFVSSSTGYIRVNGTSASVPNPQVPVGGDVNLYFGEVTWSRDQLYLLLSHDDTPKLSAGDSIYTPLFSVYDVTNTSAPSVYTSAEGTWVVGNNWVNGSIPDDIPVGNYTIKAVDEVTSDVAVTDTFIIVYKVVYNGDLAIYPSSGPGGVPVEFSGAGYEPNVNVTISYYDPTFGTWTPWAVATANGTGFFQVDSEVPDLRKSVGIGDYPETYSTVSYRTEVDGDICAYTDYNQYSRGLKRVGNEIASGLYGNGTNFASTVQVEVGDSMTISGKWFHPGDAIYVRWDSVSVVGTVTSDEWLNAVILNSTIADANGSFELRVTVPDASGGEHYVAVEDSQTRVIVIILLSRGSLQISPTSGPGGSSVQFTGSGYTPLETVTLSYFDPAFNSWIAYDSTQAASSGNIAFTTEMPDLRRALSSYDSSEQYTTLSFRTEHSGFIYSYADFYEYWRGLKRVGNQYASGLFGNGTDFSVGNESAAVSVNSGDSLLISGRWFHSNGVVYIRWDGSAVVGTVTSDEWRNAVILGSTIASASGSFEKTVTIPTADVGPHYVSVEDSESRVIIKVYLASSPSPTPTPEPTPAPTPTPPPKQPGPTIDLSCKGTKQYSGFDVEIYGAIMFDGVPSSGESVLISYSVNDGASWTDLTSARTGSEGAFKVVWNPSVTGNYLIKARWVGNSTFNEASTIVNFALAPYSDETWFSLTSTSTITEFAFNSTSKELSFTASGPEGTTGHVNVYIPKSLINDISDLNVYVDEIEITYSSESVGDSWMVSFSYTHSTHRVVIALSSAAKADGAPLELILTTAIGAAIAVAVTAAVFFKRKRSHKIDAVA
jgi:hypothetical protein